MKKSEIISAVLSVVSEETEIEIRNITSQSKRREIVDARHIAIFLLSKQGIYTPAISEIFKLTPRNIQYILSDFDTRLLYSPTMRNDYERILKRIRINSEVAAK